MEESSLERKSRALKRMLDEADLSEPGTEGDLRAENEVAWEIGVFDGTRERPLSDEDREGLLVRARRDALTARYYSLDALRRLNRMEANLTATRTVLLIAAAWIFLAIVFGWRF